VGFAYRVSALVTETAVADAGFEFNPLTRTTVVGIGEDHAIQHRAPVQEPNGLPRVSGPMSCAVGVGGSGERIARSIACLERSERIEECDSSLVV
jgi:hypothetical protein